MPVHGGPNTVEDGLVLSLDAADRNSYPGSGTIWNDLTGNGNNGTLTNGPTFDSGSGGSIAFDYTNDYVTTTGMEDYEYINGITVSVWHYNGGGTGRYRGVVTNGTTDDRVGGFDLRYGRENYYGGSKDGTTLRWRITTNSQSSTLSIYAERNEWHNYVGTFDNTNVKTFKDGQNWNSSTLSTNQLKTKSASTTIGLSPGTVEYLDGKLAIVQVYNRALTSSEILQNYNAQKSRFGL